MPTNSAVIFSFLLVISFIASCSNKPSNHNVIEELNSGLIESNKSFIHSNQDILSALENRMTDFRAKEKVIVWLPKAKKLFAISESQIDYLEKLKEVITNNSGEEKLLLKQLFVKDTDVKKLSQRVNTYWQDMLSVDSKLKLEIASEIESINKLNLPAENQSELEELYFTSVTGQEAISFLSKLQNTTLRTQKRCLLFCYDQTVYLDHGSMSEAIVAQNAKILKAGDELEISAGVGSFFSRHKTTKIVIANEVIELNDKSIGIYKFKTSKKVGDYSLPVKIQFIDEDGNPQERVFTVEYSLVEGIKKQ